MAGGHEQIVKPLLNKAASPDVNTLQAASWSKQMIRKYDQGYYPLYIIESRFLRGLPFRNRGLIRANCLGYVVVLVVVLLVRF